MKLDISMSRYIDSNTNDNDFNLSKTFGMTNILLNLYVLNSSQLNTNDYMNILFLKFLITSLQSRFYLEVSLYLNNFQCILTMCVTLSKFLSLLHFLPFSLVIQALQ